MSDSQNNGNQKKKESWAHLRDASRVPKGPAKPWDEQTNALAEEFVEFLKDGTQKKAMQDFLIDAFKRFEGDKLAQLQARMENEKRVDEHRMADFHKPGNIGPIMSEAFNMFDAERSFARGLKQTKANLVRAVEDRVEEINRLLSGLGGFSSQIKSCFARSTVVFLEEEDPKHNYRERLIFSINLPSYELKRQWANGPAEPAVAEGSAEPKLPAKRKAPASRKPAAPGMEEDDPRTPLQATWDDAVNALAQIIATTGLKPKYCKNDRHYGRFVMKQDLRSQANLPDEYFSFTLDYNTADRIKEMCVPYNRIVGAYEKKIKKLAKKLEGWSPESTSPRYLALRKKHLNLVQERDFFAGTTPDPNQLSEGLLFLIEVSTLKDYHIVKDRMQAIMTKYILHLSKLAAKDADFDPDLEYEMWKKSWEGKAAEQKPQLPAGGEFDGITAEELASVPEYVIDETGLKPLKKKAG